MKKIILALMVLSLPCAACAKSYVDAQLKNVKNNVKYNTVKVYERNYNESNISPVAAKPAVKDPKLIKLSEFTPISDADYEKKLAEDEKAYQSQIIPAMKKKSVGITDEPSAVDFYNLYRISEKLIRANNLDYTNWLISVRKTPDVNAYSSDINHITVYTGLYDTYYSDNDALAYVLAHEMSHAILGHQKQLEDLERKIIKLEAAKKFGELPSLTQKALLLKYYKDLRSMEYMADTEAMILMAKAGFAPEKALVVLNSFETLSEYKSLYNSHPVAKDRIASYKENLPLIDPDWVNVGRENIYNSSVLPCKKSSDRVSIVISKTDKYKKFYTVEDMQARLKRIAYMNYLNGNFKNAVKYFGKLAEINENDYIPYVYLSLSNMEMYNSLKNKKYLQDAQEAITKANQLKPGDSVVRDIMSDMKL